MCARAGCERAGERASERASGRACVHACTRDACTRARVCENVRVCVCVFMRVCACICASVCMPRATAHLSSLSLSARLPGRSVHEPMSLSDSVPECLILTCSLTGCPGLCVDCYTDCCTDCYADCRVTTAGTATPTRKWPCCIAALTAHLDLLTLGDPIERKQVIPLRFERVVLWLRLLLALHACVNARAFACLHV